MLAIAANLDDLQSGVEASSRAADSLRADASRYERLTLRKESALTLSSVTRHAAELRMCLRDQLAALQELRGGINRLREELTRGSLVRPAPAHAHDRQRR